MSDRLSSSQRHNNMAAIKGKDTKPEMIVRRFLWSRGIRYRINHPRLPGKPDVVLRKYRTCVFVNGCFWHGHYVHTLNDIDAIENSECCKIPHTNREFWVKKIMRNKERDIEVQKRLAEMGWHCITIWECELSTKQVSMKNADGSEEMVSVRQQTLERLAYTLNKIFLQNQGVAITKDKGYKYASPDDNSIGMAAEEEPIG